MNFRLLLFCMVMGTAARAQHCTGFQGTKTLYAAPGRVFTPAPKGYAPIFINHIGRHGARHLTKLPSSTFAWKLLKKADSLGALTANGRQLKSMSEKLEEIEKDEVELISQTGRDEQTDLAQRMREAYPDVFKDSRFHAGVVVAKKKRTLQTAEAFMNALLGPASPAPTSFILNDTLLRFYDLSPNYLRFSKEGNWITEWQAVKKNLHANAIALDFASEFFDNSFLHNLNSEALESFTSDIFGFATIQPSLVYETEKKGYKKSELDFSALFTCKQLTVLGRIDEAEDFYLKGPGSDANGIQVKIAAPLLADFIRTTDEALATKNPGAAFRFGHAETIAPFAALLQLKGASEAAAAGKPSAWKAATVLPLSANIQWVLYTNRNGDALVKILLNEKKAAINGLRPFHFPYYRWQDVRAFYIRRLASLGMVYGRSGYEYLQQP